MSKLFDESSDSEVEIKTDNDYAKKYDNWRQKEELNKFKTKYGEDPSTFLDESSESTTSSDDDEAKELTEGVERDFFKTLASLKSKDPKIYDPNVSFFNSDDEGNDETVKDKSKKARKKDRPLSIRDYERNFVLRKGIVDDDKEEISRSDLSKEPASKRSLGNWNDSENEDEDWMREEKSETPPKDAIEKDNFKKWLLGKEKHIRDKKVKNDLNGLRNFWNDPNLPEDEKFLRDYLLNDKYLDKEDDNVNKFVENDLSEDEKELEKQDEFEHKFNFRFEEPDPEFIKRYPRTIQNSLRLKDEKRKQKRIETKERKKKEKLQKMEELKQLRSLKLKEIEEKISKLRDVTGIENVEFSAKDIEGDFDPEEHDKRMRKIFDDKYYRDGADEQKPEFPDLDEELEIERWDRYRDYKEEDRENLNTEKNFAPDEDSNMDCDYDPNTAQELIDNTKNKRKRRRRSKFAVAVREPKPVFDPNSKTYQQYLDEYYKLDCEDVIGDVPCRFKYREVVPNSFGLTVEEILAAEDKELNRWCSLKKAVQYRPDHVEHYDVIAYQKKGQNVALKKKILPSLFNSKCKSEAADDAVDKEQRKRKKNRGDGEVVSVRIKKSKQKSENVEAGSKSKKELNEVEEKISKGKDVKKIKSKKTARKPNEVDRSSVELSSARLKAFGIKAKDVKNKLKHK